jgi:lysozyme
VQAGQAARDLIKSFEKCHLTAYQDPGGIWTIGWGHTGGVTAGQTITQAQADIMFANDVARIAWQVEQLVKPEPITQQQFDALVSFAYNEGAGPHGLGGSHLLFFFKAGHPGLAAVEFPRWNLQGSTVLLGLIKRRFAEGTLFLEGTN